MMMGTPYGPDALAAMMGPQGLMPPAATAPASLAESMGDLLPPAAAASAPAPPTGPVAGPGALPVPASPAPRGNLMPPPPPVPRPNLLPPSADPTPGAPPMVPATAHAPPVDRKQAAMYFLNAANQISGAFR